MVAAPAGVGAGSGVENRRPPPACLSARLSARRPPAACLPAARPLAVQSLLSYAGTTPSEATSRVFALFYQQNYVQVYVMHDVG